MVLWKELGSVACVRRELQNCFGMVVGIKAVRYWVAKDKNGGVERASRAGRPKRVDTHAARVAVELLQDVDNYGTADNVAAELHRRGLTGGKPVHKSTLIRAAVTQSKADGDTLEVATGPPRKELTQVNMQQRMDFCKANMSTNWAHHFFTDMKKFSFRFPGTKKVGCKWILQSNGGKKGYKCYQPNHPQTVNLYMGMCKWGVSKVHKVTGSKGFKSPFKNKKGQPARGATAEEYHHVLRASLLPEGSRLFSQQGLSSFTFQQDNDPSHKKPAIAEVAAWNAAHPGKHVKLLPNWPPNSPDLNPIENVWGIVQRQVDAMGCQCFDEFEAAVVDKLKNFPQATLMKLVSSMHKRVRMVMQVGGNRIKY